MTPEEWSRVKALFDEAADLDAGAARDRFVAAIESETARAEVKRLLALHDAESAIFDKLQPDPKLVRSAAELRSLNTGDRIGGRFRIVRFIAEGGMGEVYEAQDEQLNERVAVKTLRLETSQDSTALARFRQEIQLARRVTNPNVCRIHDLWEHQTAGGRSIWFLTMEFLEGETLARRIERGAMPVADVLPLLQQMASGLGAAHDAGIVHRDFKSSNVILVPRQGGGPDRAVVTDFGLSRSFDVRTTASGAVMGTPAYMAPEQIEGGELGPATDVYALGVVLYEMLTGMLPFRSSSPMALAVKKLRETPVPPSQLTAEVPAVWDQVVMRCMQYRMADRFPSPAALMEAIETGKLPSLRGPDLEFRVPARWWQVGLVLLASVAGVGHWFWGRDRGFEAKPEAVDWYYQGVAKLNDDAPNLARGLFEKALESDPGFVPARARLAQALAELESVDRARDELLKLTGDELHKLRQQDRLLVDGVRAVALRDYKSAVKEFSAFVSLAGTKELPGAYVDLARAQLSAQSPRDALKSCDQALARERNFAGALLLKARAHSMLGERQEALRLLDQAEEGFGIRGSLDGKLAAKLVRISELMEVRNLEGSEAEARRALALSMTLDDRYQEVRLHRALAVVLRKIGRFDDSVREAEAAQRLARANRQLSLEVLIQNDLAKAMFAQYRYEEAERLYKQSIQLSSEYRLPYQEAYGQMYLAEVLFRMARGPEGQVMLDKAIEYFRRNGLATESMNLLRLQTNGAIESEGYDAVRSFATAYLDMAVRSGISAELESAFKRMAHLNLLLGDLPAAITFNRKGQEKAAEQGKPLFGDRLNEARMHIEIGDGAGVREILKRNDLEMISKPDAIEVYRLRTLLIQARLAAIEGRFEEGLSLLQKASPLVKNPTDRGELELLTVRLLALQGRIPKAEEHMAMARKALGATTTVDLRVKCDCVNGELLLAAGRKREAAALARSALALGNSKAQRLALWHCAAVEVAADPFVGNPKELELALVGWDGNTRSSFRARKDLRHLAPARESR